MSKTHYIILQEKEEGIWREYATDVLATSAKGAIRAAMGMGEDDGEFVAVPHRSWRPQPVKVETQQRLKIG